jgi:hypothetical protein
MRQRNASAWLLVRRRDQRSSVWRSSSDNTIGTVGRPRRRLGGGFSVIAAADYFHSESLTQDTRRVVPFGAGADSLLKP